MPLTQKNLLYKELRRAVSLLWPKVIVWLRFLFFFFLLHFIFYLFVCIISPVTKTFRESDILFRFLPADPWAYAVSMASSWGVSDITRGKPADTSGIELGTTRAVIASHQLWFRVTLDKTSNPTIVRPFFIYANDVLSLTGWSGNQIRSWI